MKKKYLYNGQIMEHADIEDAAKQSKLDVDSYVRKVGIKVIEDSYDYQGKSYSAQDVLDAAKQSNVGFDDYIQKVGFTFKKKVSSSDLGNGGSQSPSPSPSPSLDTQQNGGGQQPTGGSAPSNGQPKTVIYDTKEGLTVTGVDNGTPIQKAPSPFFLDQVAPLPSRRASSDIATTVDIPTEEKVKTKETALKNTRTAIDNTVRRKVAKLKAKGFTPSKQEEDFYREQVVQQYDNGDLVIRNEGGELAMKKGAGFFESIPLAIDASFRRRAEAEYVNSLSTQEKIAYFNMKAQGASAFLPKEDEAAPVGAGGVAGELIGGTTDLIAKGAAGATASTRVVPTPQSAVFGAFVGMANDLAKGGNIDAIERNYYALKEQGVPEAEAMQKAETLGLVGAATEMGVGLVQSMTGTSVLKPSGAASGLVNGIMKAGGKLLKYELPKVAASEVVGRAGQAATESAAGVDIEAGDVAENIVKNILGELALPVGISILVAPTKVPSYLRAQAENVVASAPPSERAVYLDGGIKRGIITPEESVKAVASVNRFAETKKPLEGLPISEEHKAAITGKLIQVDKLKKEKEQLSKFGGSFTERVGQLDQEIVATENDIAKMYAAEDVFTLETDNVTGEPAVPQKEVKPSYKVNGKEVDAATARQAIETGGADTFIEIENDAELQSLLEEKGANVKTTDGTIAQTEKGKAQAEVSAAETTEGTTADTGKPNKPSSIGENEVSNQQGEQPSVEESKPSEVVTETSSQPEELKPFESIVRESSTVDEAFKKVRELTEVPPEVSKLFREKYDPEENLTPKQAFETFYNEVKSVTPEGNVEQPVSSNSSGDVVDVNGVRIKEGDTVRTQQQSGGALSSSSEPTVGVVEKTKDAFGNDALQIVDEKGGKILIDNQINEVISAPFSEQSTTDQDISVPEKKNVKVSEEAVARKGKIEEGLRKFTEIDSEYIRYSDESNAAFRERNAVDKKRLQAIKKGQDSSDLDKQYDQLTDKGNAAQEKAMQLLKAEDARLKKEYAQSDKAPTQNAARKKVGDNIKQLASKVREGKIAKEEIEKLSEEERASAIDTLIFGERDSSPNDVVIPEEAAKVPPLDMKPYSQGLTVRDALNHLIENENKFSALAQEVLNTTDEASLSSKVGWKNEKGRSYYTSEYDRIVLSKDAISDARVIMHEIIHAATSKKIPTNLKNPSYSNSYGKAYLKELNSYLKDSNGDGDTKTLIKLYLKAVKELGYEKQLFEGDEQVKQFRADVEESANGIYAYQESKAEMDRLEKVVSEIAGKENVETWTAGRGYGWEMRVKPEGAERLKASPIYSSRTQKYDNGETQEIKSLTFDYILKEKATAGNQDLTVQKGAPYGLGNLDEFLAEAFTSIPFQKKLASIKDDNGVSLWQKFINAVKKIVGIETEGTLLNSVIKTGANIIAAERTNNLKGATKLKSPPSIDFSAAIERLRKAGYTDAEIAKEFEQRNFNKSDYESLLGDSKEPPKPPIDTVVDEGGEGDGRSELLKMATNIPKSDNLREYGSKSTILKYHKDEPRNAQEIFEQELRPALEHGEAIVDKAKEVFGKDYVENTLDFLNEEKLRADEKALVYISLENDMMRRVLADPDNAGLKKLQDLVRAKSQEHLRTGSLAINYGKLRKIGEVGYDISQVTDTFFTSSEKQDKAEVESAIQSDADAINKEAANREYSDADLQEKINTAVEEEITKIYEKLPTDRRKRADKAIAALEKMQQNIRSKTYDATIGVPLALIDAGITIVKRAIKAGVQVADAIELGISHIKQRYGKEWAKETEFRQDMAEGFAAEGIAKEKEITNKQLVKGALIEAGFGRDINVKVNATDADGKPIMKDGKPVKETQTRTILDWKKLAGAESSVDRLRENVSKVLEDRGYTADEISAVNKELESEYHDLRASIIEHSINELNKRNKKTVTTEQKSAARKLAELYNYGLFEKNPVDYQVLLGKAIGIEKLNPERFKQSYELGKALETIYSTKFNGRKLNDTELRTALQVIEDKMRWILHDEAAEHGSKSLMVADIARTWMDATQRMALNSLKQAVENPLSGLEQTVISNIDGLLNSKTGTTKELLKQKRNLAKAVYKDMVLKGGVGFGDVNTQFVAKGNLEMYLNRMSDNELFHAVASTAIGKTTLDAADSFFKAKLTEQKFIANLLKVLTQDRLVGGRVQRGMSKEEAVQYVSEKLTGQSFEDAKRTAKDLIDKVNVGGKKIVGDSPFFVERLANDIAKAALVHGDVITPEMVTAAYNAAYTAAGRSLGHVANNFLSRSVSGVSAKLEKDINDAVKEKDYKRAAMLTYQSIFFRNIANPFVAGGTNWVVLKFEKNGLGLVTGLTQYLGKKKVDLTSEVGLKNLETALYEDLKARDSLMRGAVGGLASVLMGALWLGLTDTDKYAKWRRDNKWAQKYVDLITPEAVLANIAAKDKKMAKYIASLINKNDQFDKAKPFIQAADYAVKGNSDLASGKLGEGLGANFGAPLPWRLVRDGRDLWLGANGKEPYAIDYSKSRSFGNGVLRGGLMEYIGLRPDSQLDSEFLGAGAGGSFNEKQVKTTPALKFYNDNDIPISKPDADRVEIKDYKAKTIGKLIDFGEEKIKEYNQKWEDAFMKLMNSAYQNNVYVDDFGNVGMVYNINDKLSSDKGRKIVEMKTLSPKQLKNLKGIMGASATDVAKDFFETKYGNKPIEETVEEENYYE